MSVVSSFSGVKVSVAARAAPAKRAAVITQAAFANPYAGEHAHLAKTRFGAALARAAVLWVS